MGSGLSVIACISSQTGFQQAIVPEANVPRGGIKGMKIVGVKTLAAALAAL